MINFVIILTTSIIGAGKTYTMLGTPSDPGIMALALQDLFRLMSDTQDDVNYQVSMSYMEVRITHALRNFT